MSAASISSVPLPHIGSIKACPLVDKLGQSARNSKAAARFSFSVAATIALRYPRLWRLSPDISKLTLA